MLLLLLYALVPLLLLAFFLGAVIIIIAAIDFSVTLTTVTMPSPAMTAPSTLPLQLLSPLLLGLDPESLVF